MGHRDDEFVTILETSDPVRAEIIRDVLEQDGIVATIPGHMHSGLLGAAGGVLFRIRVQVPRSRAEEARSIIDAMEQFDTVLPDGEEGPQVPAAEMERRMELLEADEEGGVGPYRSGPLAEKKRSPRLKRVAFMCALALTFGSGHFYARDSRTGFLLLLTEVLVFAMAFGGDGRVVWALPFLILGDAIGAVRAAERYNSGAAEKTLAEKLQRGAPWGAIAIAAIGFGGPFIYAKAMPARAAAGDIEILCNKRVRCEGDDGQTCRERYLGWAERGVRSPFDIERCADCLSDVSCSEIGECDPTCY